MTCQNPSSSTPETGKIDMFDFDAGSFSDLSETPTGKAIWEFLNSEKSIDCLKTTTYLKRPALEGLQCQLLERFGQELKFGEKSKRDRLKQMTGRMVRQIMEYHGYQLDQTRVIIRTGELFTSAARYKKIQNT